MNPPKVSSSGSLRPRTYIPLHPLESSQPHGLTLSPPQTSASALALLSQHRRASVSLPSPSVPVVTRRPAGPQHLMAAVRLVNRPLPPPRDELPPLATSTSTSTSNPTQAPPPQGSTAKPSRPPPPVNYQRFRSMLDIGEPTSLPPPIPEETQSNSGSEEPAEPLTPTSDAHTHHFHHVNSEVSESALQFPQLEFKPSSPLPPLDVGTATVDPVDSPMESTPRQIPTASHSPL